MNRLLAIGFEHAGSWALNNGVLSLQLVRYGEQKNVLYSFIAEGELRYVGKTVQTLRQRMTGYQRPGSSQLTNVRVNRLIVDSLAKGADVEVLVLPDNGLMHYGQFHLNLAAGLEDSIIALLNPPWNGGDRRRKPVAGDTIEVLPVDQFQFQLQRSYSEKGFFNVPVAHTKSLGEDGQSIDVFCGAAESPVIALLNRRSNSNGTPRIMGGSALRNWFQASCEIGYTIQVDVLSPVTIRLRTVGFSVGDPAVSDISGKN
jgi:hypothetical protein